jgi:hypothetical protein
MLELTLLGIEPAAISNGVIVTVMTCAGASDDPVGDTEKNGND